ncbi:MAG: GumC family protein [Anaeromyxobacteraceae bacterium]
MERTYTPRELLAALHRRRWLALVAGAIVLVVGAIFVVALPSEYRAESVMQIEPHQLPADFMPAAYHSFEDRMRTLKHGVLARPVLERVLRETDFYGDWKKDPDDAIERLRRSVDVRLEGEVAGGPPSLLFVVEVRGSDREKVAKAADIIPRAYAEMTRGVLATQARNVRDTLSKQLEEMSRELARHEEKLVAFKTEHATETPDAAENNIRSLAALNGQIDMRLAAIADARRRRNAALASYPEQFSETGLAVASTEDARRRLEAAKAAYGPEHPDVRKYERALAAAIERNDEGLKRYKSERLDGQLARLDAEVKEQEGIIQALQKESAKYQKRLDEAPRWGEQYRVMSREYDAVRAKYTTTLARAADAQAAESLLAADAPNLFRVVQSAHPPSRPAGPDRQKLLLVAHCAALGAGLLTAAAAEYFDTSLRGAQDASAFGVPVLAAIPRIGPRRAGAQR